MNDKTPPHRPSTGPGLWTQAALALMIPSLMLAGPVVGFGIAWLIGRWTGWRPQWFTILMVLLGLAAGIRETIRVIRRLP